MAIFSCRKDSEIKCKNYVTVNFNNHVNGQEILFDTLAYTNPNGELYSFNVFKYYISHLTLIQDNGTEVELFSHELIDEANELSTFLNRVEVPEGHYTAVKFYLGVDSLHNHSGDQLGDLDPINGMIWTWNTGYVFYKHEGNFISSNSGTSQPLVYHYGTDLGLVPIELPISMHSFNTNHSIRVDLDVNKIYGSSGVVIPFTDNNNHQSVSASDLPWINKLKSNIENSFSASVYIFE
ncbi:MAG: MbnP family protein [Bacteroidota bacterium]